MSARGEGLNLIMSRMRGVIVIVLGLFLSFLQNTSSEQRTDEHRLFSQLTLSVAEVCSVVLM